MAEIRISSKNGRKQCYNGYSYDYAGSSADEGTLFWRCEKSRSSALKCRGRLHTDAHTGEVRGEMGEHCHSGDATRKIVLQVQSAIRARAANTQEQTHQLVTTATGAVSDAVKGQLQGTGLLKQMVRRQRKRDIQAPPAPATLDVLEIPAEWQQYEKAPGEMVDFLLWDSGHGADRILIFSTPHNLAVLERCTEWFCDGTFKVTPPLFSQMYTVHGESFGQVHPLVYALLPNKLEATYDRMFAALKELRPRLNPQRVMTDFERGAINAIMRAFPTAQPIGCFFHFGQAIWRKVQQLALSTLYNTNEQFKLTVCQLTALAFCPIANVDDYYAEVCQLLENFPGLSPEQRQAVDDLIVYFERTYVGTLDRRGHRRIALFPIELWSVYERTINGIARTNNAAEAWHRGLSDTFNMQHPTIWRFIEGLRREQQHRDVVIEGLVAGNNPRQQKKVYKNKEARIRMVLADCGNRQALDFLRGIA